MHTHDHDESTPTQMTPVPWLISSAITTASGIVVAAIDGQGVALIITAAATTVVSLSGAIHRIWRTSVDAAATTRAQAVEIADLRTQVEQLKQTIAIQKDLIEKLDHP